MVAKKPSSPRKLSTKAATQTRSTTSSTTAKTTAGKSKQKPVAARNEQRNTDPGRLLAIDVPDSEFGPTQRAAYLMLLSRGASPAAACGQLNLSLVRVAEFIEQHADFRQLLARVNELLSQNVAAALYRSAMEGSVSAQTFYLKNRPPPEWPEQADDPLSKPLNELTDDELIAQFCQEAPAVLARLTAENPSPAGIAASGSVPPSAEAAG